MSNRSIKSAICNLGLFAAVLSLAATGASAQIISVDPDLVIDGDLDGEVVTAPLDDGTQAVQNATQSGSETVSGVFEGLDEEAQDLGSRYEGVDENASQEASGYSDMVLDLPEDLHNPEQIAGAGGNTPAAEEQTTYAQDDLIGAATGVFGDGAEGLAGLIQGILEKQGEPNGYIVGREGGGALVVGVRYGSGTLFHKVEGNMPVYWTGPSVGFDAGANVGSTFVLVYNLYDTDDLYKRFPAGEGHLYFVGGFNASYMRRGDIVLIPIRVGAGLRVGINAGYMRFSRKHRWLPF